MSTDMGASGWRSLLFPTRCGGRFLGPFDVPKYPAAMVGVAIDEKSFMWIPHQGGVRLMVPFPSTGPGMSGRAGTIADTRERHLDGRSDAELDLFQTSSGCFYAWLHAAASGSHDHEETWREMLVQRHPAWRQFLDDFLDALMRAPINYDGTSRDGVLVPRKVSALLKLILKHRKKDVDGISRMEVRAELAQETVIDPIDPGIWS